MKMLSGIDDPEEVRRLEREAMRCVPWYVRIAGLTGAIILIGCLVGVVMPALEVGPLASGAVAGALGVTGVSWMRRRFIRDCLAPILKREGRCLRCGFVVRSLSSARCPECGFDIKHGDREG